jgi:hypothetical protein
MKLPSPDEAEVPRAKIVLYLLNPNHRSGKSKARFFLHHGFTVEQWMQLAEALRSHARENEISKRERTPLGERVVIEGPMRLPDGQIASIRSIWFVEAGERIPRLATAYPLRPKRQHDQRT